MCGRYASTASFDELVDEFDIDDVLAGLPGPDYNVAPTVAVPAVFERVDRESGQTRRKLGPLVWGLVPSWAKDPSIGARLINARMETVAQKPSFRRAFAARRCVLPADGFYEWYVPQAADAPRNSKGRPVKQPFFVHRSDGERLFMAGLYEIWRDPTKDPDDDSAWLRTCTVITTEATDAVGHLHDRMPLVIAAADLDAWLDPRLTDPAQALQLLHVTEPADLQAYAVSTDVNRVTNNDPSLLQPIQIAPEADPTRNPTEQPHDQPDEPALF